MYLTGRLYAESPQRAVEEREFPARQGRRTFAYLICHRLRPVPFEELAEAVWNKPVASWETALSSIVSKLRSLLAPLGGERPSIPSVSGAYQLLLPGDAWVDIEESRAAIDEAEGLVRAGAVKAAWGPACVAAAISRRPFLPADNADWIDAQRRDLHACHIGALDCLSQISLANNEPNLAAQFASDAVSLEPFRETGYQRLMRALDTMGNRGEALRVYERCRQVMAEELGVDPSPQTQAVYLEILQAD